MSRITLCRAKYLLAFGALLAMPAFAADRDASFMPVEDDAPVQAVAPAVSTLPPPAVIAPAPAARAVAPPVAAAPAVVPGYVAVKPVTASPVAAMPPVMPAAVATAPLPAPAAPAALTPVGMAKPVTAQPLPAVDPQAIGLLTENSGGLGASLWNATPRPIVERLLPELNLPTASPLLNSLARRLLLSTAAVPQGEGKGANSLTIARLLKLVALGDTAGAWQLAQMAKPDQVDDITLRLVIESALLGPAAKDVCEKMPGILATHKAPEWQKAQIVCQIRSGDTAGAQLGFDMLREQHVAADDAFMALLDKNIFGSSKQLPRLLTPLRPLNLALLRQTNMAMPPELYPHPDAALVEELLLAKASNENLRLALAERASARGLIGTTQLAGVYRDVAFTPAALADAVNSAETGAKLRALVYQALSQDKMPMATRADLVGKFLQASDATTLMGTAGQVLADLAASIPVSSDNNRFAGIATRLYVLAGRAEQAAAWYALVQGPAGHMPDVISVMKGTWPLLVLAGLVSDADYGKGLGSWLDDALKVEADSNDKSSASPQELERDNRMLRQQAGTVLMLFSAVGYAVPDEAWARVVDVAAEGKRMMQPPPVLLEQMRDAGTFNRRGEAVLTSLLLAGGEPEDVPLFIYADAVRALREVGLDNEARALAREVAGRELVTAGP